MACEPQARKSIPRDRLESDFAALLQAMTPSRELLTFARGMLRDIWEQLQSQSTAIRETLQSDVQKLTRKIETLLDRLVDADNASVIAAYEKRIGTMEGEKAVLTEKLEKSGKPKRGFDEVFQLAMGFLADPHNLWENGTIAHRQTVLKLAFR